MKSILRGAVLALTISTIVAANAYRSRPAYYQSQDDGSYEEEEIRHSRNDYRTALDDIKADVRGMRKCLCKMSQSFTGFVKRENNPFDYSQEEPAYPGLLSPTGADGYDYAEQPLVGVPNNESYPSATDPTLVSIPTPTNLTDLMLEDKYSGLPEPKPAEQSTRYRRHSHTDEEADDDVKSDFLKLSPDEFRQLEAIQFTTDSEERMTRAFLGEYRKARYAQHHHQHQHEQKDQHRDQDSNRNQNQKMKNGPSATLHKKGYRSKSRSITPVENDDIARQVFGMKPMEYTVNMPQQTYYMMPGSRRLRSASPVFGNYQPRGGMIQMNAEPRPGFFSHRDLVDDGPFIDDESDEEFTGTEQEDEFEEDDTEAELERAQTEENTSSTEPTSSEWTTTIDV